MPVSYAKKRANAKWNASKDNIMIRPSKEEGKRIRKAAEDAGESLQQYILGAIRAKIEQENPLHWETWAGSLLRCPVCSHEYCDMVECTNYCGNCGARLLED